MKKTLYILVFGAMTLLAMGCEQIITIDIPEQDPQLIVSCAFTPDSNWVAYVSKSVSIQDPGGPQPVDNAVVTINENGSPVDLLFHVSDGYYFSLFNHRPEPGVRYEVEATAPGLSTVTGTDMAPTAVVPTNLEWRDSVAFDQEYYGELTFDIVDPAGSNYYLLHVMGVDTLFDIDTQVYTFPVYLLTQDPILEYEVYSSAVMLTDETFDGQTRRVKVLMRSSEHDSFEGRLTMQFTSASESYFRYLQTLSNFAEVGFNPFAEPVRVYSNMTPGMGIFAGYSKEVLSVP